MLKIKMGLLLFFIFTNICHADILQCVGMTSEGETVNVIGDPYSDTINVNGNIVKIIGSTNENRRITTESYINKNGTVVYYSMGIDNSNNFFLIVFNSINQNPELYVPLACH